LLRGKKKKTRPQRKGMEAAAPPNNTLTIAVKNGGAVQEKTWRPAERKKKNADRPQPESEPDYSREKGNDAAEEKKGGCEGKKKELVWHQKGGTETDKVGGKRGSIGKKDGRAPQKKPRSSRPQSRGKNREK